MPILAVTASPEEAVGLEALRDGAEDCLVKTELDRRGLSRAIAFAVQRRRAHGAGIQAALDRFPIGVALLNEEGRPFLINRSAEEILSADEGLVLRHGRFQGSNAKATAALRGLISYTAQESARFRFRADPRGARSR